MDHIIVVVDEQKERLIADGVRPERISVVTNAVDADMLTSGPLRFDTAMDEERETYKLLYVGIVTSERGLDDIIRAMRLLRDRIAARFYIVGNGNYEPHLRRLAQHEGVEDLVRFVGWVPFTDIQSYMAKADLCVATFVKNGFSDTTIPNKLFQYMLVGKPVLVTNARPLARVVGECDAGFVFESGNSADAARAIMEAHERRHDGEIGERGRRCVEAKYTWEKVAPPLVELYDLLSVRPRGSGDPELQNRRADYIATGFPLTRE